MFFAKQLVGAFATPLAIALVVGIAAALFAGLGRKRISFWLAIAAATIGYLGAIGPVGDALLAPLERRYPSLLSPVERVEHIVVLGSGYAPREGIPVTAALDDDGLVRLVEAIRLARLLNIHHIVLSGGAPPGRTPPALGYVELARGLGVAEQSIDVLDTPVDTAGEAAAIVALLGSDPFIVVTSAYHMPRAVKLIEAAGGQAIPAPTGHRSYGSSRWRWSSLLPSAAGLRKTERALHEYLGLMAASLGVQ